MLDLRESAERRNRLTKKRLDTLVPRLMNEHGIDCWVLVSREYAEDPVAQTMLPAKWMSSRRRTILLFVRSGSETERYAIARYEVDGLFPQAWDPSVEPDQWSALAKKIRSANPGSIAVSTSDSFAHGDGLTETEHSQLVKALGPDLALRMTSAEAIAVGWLQTRIPEEKQTLIEACSQAHQILRRALSHEAIDSGNTSTHDLEWWLRSEVQKLGCHVWFHPSVSVQRSSGDLRGSFASATNDTLILPGDLVHIDFGIVWDHLCTDQQQHGYVLKSGETAVPDGLSAAMTKTNQLQDILLGSFATGRSGNEVLATALSSARAAMLEPTIYTHPIGYHGHGAGPTVGLWDQQHGVPGSGDVTIFGPSAWSIELMNRDNVPEWGNEEVGIMLEEEAWFENETAAWVDGRQTEIWSI